MIIPSIDLMDGQTVQLVQGARRVLDAGDPRPIAQRFARVGEIAVVDLDAALSRGSNAELMRDLLKIAPCRVGGGIRDVETAKAWLDAGATKVVLGTAARPEVLRELPRERVVAALDARDGEVVVEGWRTGTGRGIVERMRELRPYVGGFLVTFVETEGTMQGLPAERAAALLDAADGAELVVAGGIREEAEIGALDRMGVHAQVGMALYTGRISLASSLAACLQSDREDGLVPTVVVDELGVALGLAYSSAESLARAIETGNGVYHSRKRGVWEKGATSGATQELLRIDVDCDRDTLRFTVRQHGAGFCHRNTMSCWSHGCGRPSLGLASIEQRLGARVRDAEAGSYTARLANDAGLLRAKLLEEAGELAEARDTGSITHEAADVLYFAMTKLAASGVSLAGVARELERRTLRVTRRAGEAKSAVR